MLRETGSLLRIIAYTLPCYCWFYCYYNCLERGQKNVERDRVVGVHNCICFAWGGSSLRLELLLLLLLLLLLQVERGETRENRQAQASMADASLTFVIFTQEISNVSSVYSVQQQGLNAQKYAHLPICPARSNQPASCTCSASCTCPVHKYASSAIWCAPCTKYGYNVHPM